MPFIHVFLRLSVAIAAMVVLASVATGVFYMSGFGVIAGDYTSVGNPLSDLHDDVMAALQETLSIDSERTIARLSEVEVSVDQTFVALPKNAVGRLDSRGVRHAVAAHFARDHGLLITGLEPHGMRSKSAKEAHELSVMKHKAPKMSNALLAARTDHHGLSLKEVAATIVALEHLILEQPHRVLKSAYRLENLSDATALEETQVHEVLRNFLFLIWHGQGFQDVVGYPGFKDTIQEDMLTYNESAEFELSAVGLYKYRMKHQRNPFVEKAFSYHNVVDVAKDMTRKYGRWQQASCTRMKTILMANDPDRSGRIPLHTFYQASSNEQNALFQESREYLAKTGALDQSTISNPQVIIANYVTGPSNCVAAFTEHNVCCLNECERLMNDIEEEVEDSMAAPEQLLQIVANISNPSYKPPRLSESSPEMKAKLQEIASKHGGKVPLHGRLFGQWIHYAFPYECPYPQELNSNVVLSPQTWQNRNHIASNADIARYIARANKNIVGPYSTRSLDQWSDDEVLPLQDALKDKQEEPSARSMFRIVAGIMMFAAMLYTCAKRSLTILQACDGEESGQHVSRKKQKMIRKEAKKDEPPARARKLPQEATKSDAVDQQGSIVAPAQSEAEITPVAEEEECEPATVPRVSSSKKSRKPAARKRSVVAEVQEERQRAASDGVDMEDVECTDAAHVEDIVSSTMSESIASTQAVEEDSKEGADDAETTSSESDEAECTIVEESPKDDVEAKLRAEIETLVSVLGRDHPEVQLRRAQLKKPKSGSAETNTSEPEHEQLPAVQSDRPTPTPPSTPPSTPPPPPPGFERKLAPEVVETPSALAGRTKLSATAVPFCVGPALPAFRPPPGLEACASDAPQPAVGAKAPPPGVFFPVVETSQAESMAPPGVFLTNAESSGPPGVFIAPANNEVVEEAPLYIDSKVGPPGLWKSADDQPHYIDLGTLAAVAAGDEASAQFALPLASEVAPPGLLHPTAAADATA